jgi:hypothetical protein
MKLKKMIKLDVSKYHVAKEVKVLVYDEYVWIGIVYEPKTPLDNNNNNNIHTGQCIKFVNNK